MFVFYNPNPSMRRVGDCVIRAICKLTGKEWDEVFVGVVAEGFKQKDMPSANNVWGRYLKDNGYKKKNLPDTCPDCYTVKDFCNEHERGKFLLATGSHVVTAEGGDYFDTWDSGDEVPLYYFEEVKEDGEQLGSTQ